MLVMCWELPCSRSKFATNPSFTRYEHNKIFVFVFYVVFIEGRL